MTTVAESCPFRACMSFVVGGALGGFIGLFNSSIAPTQAAVQMNTRETLRDMRQTIGSNAKQFATIGMFFLCIYIRQYFNGKIDTYSINDRLSLSIKEDQ